MANVIVEICDWAKTLPLWEQTALHRIMSGKAFEDTDYETLVELLFDTGSEPSPIDFGQFATESEGIQGQMPKLVEISNVTNVNALADGQRVTFGPNLTVVFGGNGSGKSGYARILANSCFTRGDREVLPDMFRPATEGSVTSVTLTFSNGESHNSVQHDCKSPIAALRSFYVFDTTSVTAHLEKSNSLTFSPIGLTSLNELVRHTDKAREIASRRVSETQNLNPFSKLFEGGPTQTSELIERLTGNTSTSKITSFANISPEEEKKIEQLNKQIAEFTLLNVPATVRNLRRQVATLKAVRESLALIELELGAPRVQELFNLLRLRESRRDAAAQAGAAQFAVDGFTHIGTSAWSEFLAAAKKLGDLESEGLIVYPQTGALCILCQQPLSPNAIDLINRLWKFLEGEAKRLLKEVDTQVADRRQKFLALHFSALTSVESDQLFEQWAPSLLPKLHEYSASAADRKSGLIAAIDSKTTSDLVGSNLLPSLVHDLQPIEAQITDRIDALQKEDPTAKVAMLKDEVRDLLHRRILKENLQAVLTHVGQLQWASAASKRIKDSRHITKKYNDLFEARVTDRYRGAFENLVHSLGRPLKARIATRGQKGSTVKVLALDLPEGIKHPKASPQYVFSEGEKRAVVLADFLTEVTLDPQSAGIILDDPVTSLDAEWKTSIADLLAKQSIDRQVIIFTHDLHFLYLLKASAERVSTNFLGHWLQRGVSSGRPGHVSLANSPATEQDFKSSAKAQEFLQRAMKADGGEDQEMLLKSGFGALRTSYEVFVMNELFGEVIKRFEERISIERLKNALLDPEIVASVIEKVGLLSRYIEGHSHSDTYVAVKPTVETLRAEISDFDSLRAKLKSLKRLRPLIADA